MPDAIIDDRSGIARILPIAPAAYLALVKVLRVSGAQTLSKLGVYDGVGTIALGLTLASIIVPRMSGLTGGLTALGVLVALQYLVKATLLLEPLLLHRDGEPSRHPMRNQRVTLDELFAAVFLAGGGSHDRAAAVFLKSDGFLTANAPAR